MELCVLVLAKHEPKQGISVKTFLSLTGCLPNNRQKQGDFSEQTFSPTVCEGGDLESEHAACNRTSEQTGGGNALFGTAAPFDKLDSGNCRSLLGPFPLHMCIMLQNQEYR